MTQKTKEEEIKSVAVSSYPHLVRQVREELSSLEFFVKRRTVEAYWKVGKFIHDYLLQNKKRADYGHTLYERLANDVQRDKATLMRSVQFYRAYPILASWRELSWSHYRVLISIKEKDLRERLETKAIQRHWDSNELQEYLNRVRNTQTRQSDSDEPPPRLDFNRGRLYIYMLSKSDESGEKLVLDLGFRIGRAFEEASSSEFSEKDCVYALKHKGTFSFTKITAPREELFAYPAKVEKVIDGDTLWAIIDLGFGIFIEQKLRLRGIDCAEMDTQEGQRAKRFVQDKLNKVDLMVIKTYKDSTDKYDRYLVDIFYLPAETGAERIAQEGRYLNQELLNEGLACIW